MMQTLNLYTYVMNNPLRYFDPTGLFSINIAEDMARADRERQQRARENTIAVTDSAGNWVSPGSNNNQSRPTEQIVVTGNGAAGSSSAGANNNGTGGAISNPLPSGNVAMNEHALRILQSINMTHLIDTHGVHFATNFANAYRESRDRLSPSTPYFIHRDGNLIIIQAGFNMTGDATSATIGGVRYDDAFLQGVREHWTGTFGQFEVFTFARRMRGGIPVNIGHVNLTVAGDFSHMLGAETWSPSTPGSIVMRTGDSRPSVNRLYTLSEFVWVSAHEFGHIMGVDDTWDRNHPERTDPTRHANVTSMFNAFGTSVQERDIRMVLRAWDTGTWRTWQVW